MSLREDRFERREWVALCFARACAVSGLTGIDAGLMREFEALYSKRERAYVLKFVRMMDFFNAFGNLFIRAPWKRQTGVEGTCSLPGADYRAGE